MTARDVAILQLRNAGISPSAPRVAVLQFLMNNKIHPTVDVIYSHLSPQYPTLSRTTVYNTLKLFVNKKMVQAITIEDGELRYDINTSFHAHFKCSVCGKVLDMPDMQEPVPPPLPGAKFICTQLSYYGICPECIANV